MTEDDLRYLSAEVRRLADIEEIKQLRARYTRWIDSKDWDALGGELTEDFHADTQGGVLEGRAAFVGSLSRSLSSAATAHHCHTPEIEITGPDTATGIWAMQDHVSMTLKGAPFSFRGAGHYYDTYVRTGSGWRMASTALKRLSVDPLTSSPS
jgi:SnoaL-like domain